MEKNMNNVYRNVAIIEFKDTTYQMFLNAANKCAYLIIEEDGSYSYPTLGQLLEVHKVSNYYNPYFNKLISKDNLPKKHKKYSFIPKIKHKAGTLVITTSLIATLMGCGNDAKALNNTPIENNSNTIVSEFNLDTEQNEKINDDDYSIFDSYADEYNTSESYYDKGEFYDQIATADDDLDFRWKYDYYKAGDRIFVTDVSAYKEVFNFSKPTLNDLERAIDNNPNLGKYKSYYKDLVRDILERCPDTDLSILYYNLQTLKIVECTKEEMQSYTLSWSAEACYRAFENTMYLKQDMPMDKGTDGYIEFRHESLHVASMLSFEKDGVKYKCSFVPVFGTATYTEEALITNIVYDMEGLDRKSEYYPLLCNYLRIITDCCGSVNAEDFLNHSVNNVIGNMGEFMGDPSYAAYILKLLDYEYNFKNTGLILDGISNFSELHDYIIEMYMKKYLQPGMTEEEAEEVYNNFVAEITCNLDGSPTDYDEKNPDIFRPKFEQICESLDITSVKTR